MADKFRNTFPISVTFSAGEEPTSTKLNGLSSQAKNGLSLTEYAIGDVWNQAGDAVLDLASGAALMIPNLARYLGATKHLSPRIPYLPNITEYTYKFTAEAGKHEARLTFPPAAGTSYTWSGAGSPPSSLKATKDLVVANTDWWIDTDTGDIYTYAAINANWYLAYKPVVDGDLGTATFNIIPDPDTDTNYTSGGYGGVKIAYVNGSDDSAGYYIYLPPRGPLTNRRTDKAPQDVTNDGHTSNFSTSPGSNPLRFWQWYATDADTSSNAEHYRYVLPKLLTDNWSQDATLPAGYLYLWDDTGTGTIIDGLVFKAENAATPRKYVLVVSGSNLTTWLSTTGATAYPVANMQAPSATDHDPSFYPSTGGLKLITVGSDLSAAFSSLLGQYLNHDHGSQGSLVSSKVKHSKLEGLFCTSGTPQLTASYMDNDDHPMYLERHGYSTRDKYKNMLLGDLVLSSTADGGSDYDNLGAVSRKVVFGNGTGGPSIYYDPSYGTDGSIILTSTDGTDEPAFRFSGTSTVASDYIEMKPQYSVTGYDSIKAPNPLLLEGETGGANVASGILDRNGFELRGPSTAAFTYPNQTVSIVVPLGTGHGKIRSSTEATSLGWAPDGQGDTGGGYPSSQRVWTTSNSASANLVFYITDVPNGFLLQSVMIYYAITGTLSGPTYPCQLFIYKTSFVTPDAGTQFNLGTAAGYMPGTNDAPTLQGYTLVTPANFTRTLGSANSIIQFQFVPLLGSSETIRVWPMVLLTGKFKSASDWKQVDATV